MPKIPRQQMETHNKEDRKRNFNEVAIGYSLETALKEAERCLQCKTPLCQEGCPVNIEIKEFIAHLKNKDFEGASEAIKRSSTLPAVCGRVCPQEKQCEAKCVLAKKGKPVAIGNLERFVGDLDREKNNE